MIYFHYFILIDSKNIYYNILEQLLDHSQNILHRLLNMFDFSTKKKLYRNFLFFIELVVRFYIAIALSGM